MLFIATPMFGGQCAGIYADSMCRLMDAATRNELPITYRFYYNSSLVTAARTLLANEFMNSGADHLLFIDADIGFDAAHVLELLSLQVQGGYDVIGGIYPKKNIHWDMVAKAVRNGTPDKDLGFHTGNYAVSGNVDLTATRPQEASYLGAGFMLIPRSTFALFDDAYPDRAYGTDKRSLYFQAEIQDGTYISEDIFFCNMVRKAGGHVWCCPWIKLRHFGNHVYGGPPADFVK